MNHFLLKILQSEGRSRASSEGEMELSGGGTGAKLSSLSDNEGDDNARDHY